jgi:predicted MPP superfamily phosphohydrolase
VDIGGFHLNPAYLIHQYVKGLFVEEGKQLYVNVGVGVVGAPVRTIPPEITLLTLEKG